MSDVFKVNPQSTANSWISADKYQQLYQESITDPVKFWREAAQIISWHRPFTKVKNSSFAPGNISIKWFEDGELNACANCLDRHASDSSAIIWLGENENEVQTLSYNELLTEVKKLASSLRALGVGKGDRVAIYMPMIPQAVVAMLACARIGAIHSVVFGGFSAESLASRIEDCNAKVLITADEGRRAGKVVPFKKNSDLALSALKSNSIQNVVVVRRTSAEVPMTKGRDLWYDELIADVRDNSKPEVMNAEDPLFILSTSGSTSKPKGLVHTTGGYMVYAALSFKYIFDYKVGDVYWCTADIGWITGHSYLVYGPLANGATILLFEGVPQYPNPSRYWQIVQDYKVNILYTAPTTIRSLMRFGLEPLKGYDLSSLKLLGSVGEPINAEAWHWYYKQIGNSRCPIVDTWWQTETGGILITPLPGATDLKPASATKPFFGIRPQVLDANGEIITSEAEGSLVIADSWPAQARTILNDHKRFEETYFSSFKGYYFSGDGARRDKDGYFWITGRIDDVINVSGHRISTAEVESAINSHSNIAESAVVGYPHEIKGQGIYAFVCLKDGCKASDEIEKAIKDLVTQKIGKFATPDIIQWTPNLPKTRSGKIMRRILRKIAVGEADALGDTSTLAEPDVVNILVAGFLKLSQK
jgi:acetyl-CoA synthetase